MMQEDVVEIRAIFQGEVQGVGFRATAKRQALHLGLTGTVRNLADGSVEVCAVGNRSRIDAFLAHLKGPQGPGSVSKVVKEEKASPRHYEGFSIL